MVCICLCVCFCVCVCVFGCEFVCTVCVGGGGDAEKSVLGCVRACVHECVCVPRTSNLPILIRCVIIVVAY